MKYSRFKQLWNALVMDRERSQKDAPVSLSNGASKATLEAFANYGEGNKDGLIEVQRILDSRG